MNTPLYELVRELCRTYSPEEVRAWQQKHWPSLDEMFRAFEELGDKDGHLDEVTPALRLPDLPQQVQENQNA